MGPYRRLLGFLRPHKWRLAGTVLGNFGAAVLDVFSFTLLIPFLNALFDQPPLSSRSGLVDDLLRATVGVLLDPADKMGSLQRVVIVILVAVTLKNILVWVANQLGVQLQEYVTRDLRNAVYRHLQDVPLLWFSRNKTGQVLSRVLNDTASTRQLVAEIITRSLQAGAMVVATVVALVDLSWRLTVLALVVAPLLIAGLQPLLRKLRKRHRILGHQLGELTSIVQETVSAIRLVKSFRAEDYEMRRFLAVSDGYAKGHVRTVRLALLAGPITETLGTVSAVAILWYGARLVLVEGALSGAVLITFLILVMRLLQPLKTLSQLPTTAQQALASAERVFELLDTPGESARDRGTRTDARVEREVAFDHVSFAYEGSATPVLRDISFTAGRGEVVALVGASGAGKSTLVDLIPRFHDPTAGRILIDGTDIREFRLASLRALTGIVSQDTVLFNDTVRANLAYGRPEKYSQEQVEAAARAANAHDFISALPEGYDTILGERGTRLSGGQRQRLAIARALLTDPPILILDEATSALDTESERLVQEAIDRLLAGRTVFVIAHRLSTVVHADRILVLDRGAIVERGTHAELIARRGVYHRLHAMQFASGAAAADAPLLEPAPEA